MAVLAQVIAALNILSTSFEMIPLVGENLKAATELAAKICEGAQVVKENREGYENLGVQVAELLMSISTLQRTEPARLGAMTANIAHLLSVLEDIKAAIEKRSALRRPQPKRDPLSNWLNKRATLVKRMSEDPAEISNLRRKLKEVMDEFQVSALIRNDMNMDVVQNLSRSILECVLQLQAQTNAFKDAENERIRCTEEAQLKAHRDADNALLDSLGPVSSAAWNVVEVPLCAPNTRVSVLDDIMTWVGASDGPCLFWMNGLAGTGKSTIARTLCQRLDKQRLLGASFFVSREQADRRDASKIVRTIAHQLAGRMRHVADALCAELRERSLSTPRSMENQIADFIIGPASAMNSDVSLILVLDALDECFLDARGRPGGEFLQQLVRQLMRLSGRLKLFITSRIDPGIQHMFRDLSSTAQHTVVKLHDLDETVVKDDIRTYLMYSVGYIRSTRVELELDHWPLARDVDRLVQLCGLLFIYAATAVRYMDNWRYSPRQRLAQLLEPQHDERSSSSNTPYFLLDKLYMRVLTEAVGDDTDQDMLCQRLKAVVTVIVLAQTPLRLEAVSSLSGVSLDDARLAIQSLSSVLLADPGEPIHVFHPSFPDFAVDTGRCTDPRLRVIPTEGHGVLALHCLVLLNRTLRYDMCDIKDSTTANMHVHDLETRLRQRVPDALRYASCFWTDHIIMSGDPTGSLIDALVHFCREHIFHWLEVQSLLQDLPNTERKVLAAIAWCKHHAVNDRASLITTLLQDTTRVLQAYSVPIRSHALQVYHSAFTTMPQCMLLQILTREALPHWLPELSSPRESHWGPLTRILVGHRAAVGSVALSPNGHRIISGSDDHTVRVWDADNYEELAKLEGHRSYVHSVVFALDGTRIASGSQDRTVRVWDAVAFAHLATLEGHHCSVTSVAYSPDGNGILSGSEDHTVCVWDALSYTQLARLGSHQVPVYSVVFSPDGARIAAGLGDHTAQIWDAATFDELGTLEGHKKLIACVAFSPDSTRIMSASHDCVVIVWDAFTFERIGSLDGHQLPVWSIACSPDGKRIVSGSEDRTVRIWDALTFEELDVRKTYNVAVSSVIFSLDGRRIISGADDHTVRVWDMVISEQVATIPGHTGAVVSIAVSPDGDRVVSCSRDNTIRVWDAVKFNELAQLAGRGTSVVYSLNGRWILTGHLASTIRVWTAATFDLLTTLEGHDCGAGILSLAISIDSTRVAAACYHQVTIWNTGTFEKINALRYFSSVDESLAFSPDGKTIFSRLGHNTRRAWRSNGWENVEWWEEFTPSASSLDLVANSKVSLSDSGWLSCSIDTRPILLWLPVERRGRPNAVATAGRRVVIGAESGALTFLVVPGEKD